jgi:hypothetical protein
MNENTPWVASLETQDAEALGELRLLLGLELAEDGPRLWLRGPGWDDALALALRKVPGLRRFGVLPGGQLLPSDARVPHGRLPELRWRPLREWFGVVLPPVRTATRSLHHAPVTLVRSVEVQPANALLTDLTAWRAFAVTTAAIRLRPLRFAAARDGRAWVEGVPVPAIAGRRFHVRAQVAVPCGFAWSPPVEAEVLRRWLSLAEGDVAFASAEGDWEIIRAEQCVPASRSAARATVEALRV